MRDKHQEDLQRIANFRLLDDDFMTRCFENQPQCAELVLHIILNNPDLKVESVQTQYTMKNLLGRSVRLDIYAVDSKGKRYNVEIQRSDRGAGEKRARYNSSMMDANCLTAGDTVENLPETYVIFITEHDIIGEGKPLYQVERTILGSGKLFGDGSHILYVNSECKDDTPLGLLMQDFCCTKPQEMHYDILAERTGYFKEDEEGIRTMCKVIEDMRAEERTEGRAEGRAEGRVEANLKTAAQLLSMGKLTLEEIAASTDLPLEVVRSLAAK